MNKQIGQLRHLHIPNHRQPLLALICDIPDQHVNIMIVETAHMTGVTTRDIILPAQHTGVVWDMVAHIDLIVSTHPNTLGDHVITQINPQLAYELSVAYIENDLRDLAARWDGQLGLLTPQPGDHLWNWRQQTARLLGQIYWWDE